MSQVSGQFPSSSSSAVYTWQIGDDGRLSCDCRGWVNKRPGKPRECKHTKKVEAQYVQAGWKSVSQGDETYLYRAGAAIQAPVIVEEAPEVAAPASAAPSLAALKAAAAKRKP